LCRLPTTSAVTVISSGSGSALNDPRITGSKVRQPAATNPHSARLRALWRVSPNLAAVYTVVGSEEQFPPD
jgi:hypothetical protein